MSDINETLHQFVATAKAFARAIDRELELLADRIPGDRLEWPKPSSLNAQELATVLAALRSFQRAMDGFGYTDFTVAHRLSLAEHFQDVKPLTSGQIDGLCERLNAGGLNA